MYGLKLVYTVNPGIEDIAAEEVVSELGGETNYEMLSGRVYHEAPNYKLDVVLRLRSINRAMIYLWSGRIGRTVKDLSTIRETLLRELRGLSHYVSPLSSFAVQTERVGDHEYTSMDINRIVGDIVIRRVVEETGRRPEVNLRTPEIVIGVFVKDESMIIGVVLTGTRSMHRRGYRVYDHPAALKPTLAYAMLAISGTKDKQVIVDPMCGGGTIAIEAALLHEDAEIHCYDKDPHHIQGARYNALAAGVARKIRFGVWDARRIHELGLTFDHMILNPPYGIRYGDPIVIRKLYRDFLRSAWKALPEKGRITMITTEYNFVNKIADEQGYRVVHQRTVQHGGLYPKIIVLEKNI